MNNNIIQNLTLKKNKLTVLSEIITTFSFTKLFILKIKQINEEINKKIDSNVRLNYHNPIKNSHKYIDMNSPYILCIY